MCSQVHGTAAVPCKTVKPQTEQRSDVAISVSEHVFDYRLSQSQRLDGVMESYGKETNAKQAYR